MYGTTDAIYWVRVRGEGRTVVTANYGVEYVVKGTLLVFNPPRAVFLLTCVLLVSQRRLSFNSYCFTVVGRHTVSRGQRHHLATYYGRPTKNAGTAILALLRGVRTVK